MPLIRAGRLDPVSFGQRTLGPVIAEFCLRLWAFEQFLPRDEAVLLFCARGGLRLNVFSCRPSCPSGCRMPP